MRFDSVKVQFTGGYFSSCDLQLCAIIWPLDLVPLHVNDKQA